MSANWTILDQSREASDARIAQATTDAIDAAFARGAAEREAREARRNELRAESASAFRADEALHSAGRPEGDSLPTNPCSGISEARKAAAMHWANKQAAEWSDKSGCQYCDGYCHGGCREEAA